MHDLEHGAISCLVSPTKAVQSKFSTVHDLEHGAISCLVSPTKAVQSKLAMKAHFCSHEHRKL